MPSDLVPPHLILSWCILSYPSVSCCVLLCPTPYCPMSKILFCPSYSAFPCHGDPWSKSVWRKLCLNLGDCGTGAVKLIRHQREANFCKSRLSFVRFLSTNFRKAAAFARAWPSHCKPRTLGIYPRHCWKGDPSPPCRAFAEGKPRCTVLVL